MTVMPVQAGGPAGAALGCARRRSDQDMND